MSNVPITTDETGKKVAATPIRIVTTDSAVDETGKTVASMPVRIVAGITDTNEIGQKVGSLPIVQVAGLTTTDELGRPISVRPAKLSAAPGATPVFDVGGGITLGALTLSGTLRIGTATSGTINNATNGSTITGNIPGITINSGARTYSGTPTGSAGTIANGLVETLAGATNSPNSSSVTVLVVVVTISGTPGAATIGSAYSFTPTTANGSGTKTFSYSGTSLATYGLSFSTSTGAITGTVSGSAGTITGTITVTDTSGSASLPISITVAAAGVTYVQSANLAYLWDAETISATDGQALSDWVDSKAAQGTLGTPSGQPVYKSAGAFGKPCVRFAGSQYFDLGRPTALMSLVATGDYTIMVVCTNLVAGANAIASAFGAGDTGGGTWCVINTTNAGLYNGNYLAHGLPATNLYVLFYTVRRTGFGRVMGGLNGTSFCPNSLAANSGSANWGIGTGAHATTTNGNTYSFRGDIMKIAIWNTNLAYVDVVRQTRKFFTYYGQTMPWANVARFMPCDGDSITQGTQGKVNANYVWFSAANLGRKIGEFSNNGRPGATMAQLVTDYAFQYTGLSGADALGIPYTLTWMEYANERGGAGLYTDTNNYAAQVKSIDPTARSVFMTSTALGDTTGDQTATGGLGTNPSTQGTFRITYSNAYYTTPHAAMDLVIPVHLDAAIGQIGANPYAGTWPTADFGDLTHPLGTVGMSNAHGYGRLGKLHSDAVASLL